MVVPRERRDKLLITGSGGFIGGHLAARAASDWDVVATCHGTHAAPRDVQKHLTMDVTSLESVRSILDRTCPTAVVHCAAITGMDSCARHPEQAYAVNVIGARNVAEMCRTVGARMVYLSTDLVFDGVRGCYTEEDIPTPICIYGKTKLAGEQAVLSTSTDHCIARVAWTYGTSVNEAKSSADRMIAQLQKGQSVSLFTDEYRSPIYVVSLCAAILDLLKFEEAGVFHLAGPERVSRYEFGLRAADAFGFRRSLVTGIPTGEFEFLDNRPRDCSMSSRKMATEVSRRISSIDAGLAEMTRLYAGASGLAWSGTAVSISKGRLP